MKRDPTLPILIAGSIILLAVGPFLPRWAMFLINVSLCYGIVVLGMLLLMRTGVVSFGHGLYYCLGAYAAGTLDQVFKISDMAVMLGLVRRRRVEPNRTAAVDVSGPHAAEFARSAGE